MTAHSTVETSSPAAQHATGFVTRAFGNLLFVQFEGSVRQGEVAYVQLDQLKLKGEVIEVSGQQVKVQIFEDTRGIGLGTPVSFTGQLLEAELGPGLLTTIFDGLQNPLEEVAQESGYFLPRGLYLAPLDRKRHWDYTPTAQEGDQLVRGDTLGLVMEERFRHHIMVPFSKWGRYTITWTVAAGSYSIDTVVAKARDEKGVEHSFTMVQRWPIKNPLFAGEKVAPTEMMTTGLRILDTQFPILKGGSFCTPGPFGAGKTVLQHHLSKYSDVDIVVVVACGERAGEVVEVLREFPHLIDPHSGDTLMTRTIIICNTSSMPVAARDSSVYMGITIAEYYRQMGLNVLLLADSTSRWAQAMREISGRLEEIPGDEAFPAYLGSRIAELYERSGVLQLPNGKRGSVTMCGAVSPAGGNFEEPVTQATLSVVGAFLGLSRERSDARRYPSIHPIESWTSYRQAVARILSARFDGWGRGVELAAKILKEGDEIGKRMEVVGEEGTAIEDLLVYLKAELYDFCYLQQNAFDNEDAYCLLEKQIDLFSIMLEIFDLPCSFETHDKARQFFLNLSNAMKNLNYLPFQSDEYLRRRQQVLSTIKEQSKEH